VYLVLLLVFRRNSATRPNKASDYLRIPIELADPFAWTVVEALFLEHGSEGLSVVCTGKKGSPNATVRLEFGPSGRETGGKM
jgi:hypothetical protein